MNVLIFPTQEYRWLVETIMMMMTMTLISVYPAQQTRSIKFPNWSSVYFFPQSNSDGPSCIISYDNILRYSLCQ